MKKRYLGLIIPMLLLLTLTANAENVHETLPSAERAPLEAYSLEWYRAMQEIYWNAFEEKYGRNHLPQFYTSMGCDDICCTNPDHFHWCPENICLDEAHEHSESEYSANARYARFQPLCPCHEDIPRYKSIWY